MEGRFQSLWRISLNKVRRVGKKTKSRRAPQFFKIKREKNDSQETEKSESYHQR